LRPWVVPQGSIWSSSGAKLRGNSCPIVTFGGSVSLRIDFGQYTNG
jgi:hypothetical protein